MKKWIFAGVAIALMAVMCFGDKEYRAKSGIVNKAKTRVLVIRQDYNTKTMTATAYWTLLDFNKKVIDDDAQTTWSVKYSGTDKKAWNDCLTNSMPDFLKDGRVEFTAEDN